MKHFTAIPFVAQDTLNRSEFLVYSRIVRTIGWAKEDDYCWKSTVTLADECDLSRQTVSKVIKQLVNLGYIFCEERSGKTFIIKLNWDVLEMNDEHVKSMTCKKEDGVLLNSDTGVVKKKTTKYNPKEEPIKKNHSILTTYEIENEKADGVVSFEVVNKTTDLLNSDTGIKVEAKPFTTEGIDERQQRLVNLKERFPERDESFWDMKWTR